MPILRCIISLITNFAKSFTERQMGKTFNWPLSLCKEKWDSSVHVIVAIHSEALYTSWGQLFQCLRPAWLFRGRSSTEGSHETKIFPTFDSHSMIWETGRNAENSRYGGIKSHSGYEEHPQDAFLNRLNYLCLVGERKMRMTPKVMDAVKMRSSLSYTSRSQNMQDSLLRTKCVRSRHKQWKGIKVVYQWQKCQYSLY